MREREGVREGQRQRGADGAMIVACVCVCVCVCVCDIYIYGDRDRGMVEGG